MRNALTFVFAVAVVVPVQTASAAEKPTRQEVASRQFSRRVYDHRGPAGSMLTEGFPFTTDLTGLPEGFPTVPGTWNKKTKKPDPKPAIDTWTAVGYKDTASVDDPAKVPWGQPAIDAGFCKAGQKCTFSFVYVLSVQKNYSADKLDDIGIRYVVTQEGHSTEGLIWGTENSNQRYLREKSVWRNASDEERKQMGHAVNACSTYHAAQVAAIQGP